MGILRHIQARDQLTTLLGNWPNTIPAGTAPLSGDEN